MSKQVLMAVAGIAVLILAFPFIARVVAREGSTPAPKQEMPSAAAEFGPAPTIVSMSPPNGANDVSASLAQLTVTFDRPMQAGFSWTGGGPNYPEGTGKPYWSPDQRTCTMNVHLKPGWSYRLGLNSPSHKNFKSQSGVPLTPVVWQFTTQ